MKRIILFFMGILLLSSCCEYSDEEMDKSLNWYYNLYEMDTNEVNKIVKYGECIYPKLKDALFNGAPDSIVKSYQKELENTYDRVKGLRQSKTEFVKYYLSNQKASYQIRSIEPMFLINKEKTKQVIEGFIAKTAVDSTLARKDVVDYAKARLIFYK